MKFIRWLFGLCDHKWEIIKEKEWREGVVFQRDESLYFQHTYIMQCGKCGKITSKTINR